jgi:hypothetical protein
MVNLGVEMQTIIAWIWKKVKDYNLWCLLQIKTHSHQALQLWDLA